MSKKDYEYLGRAQHRTFPEFLQDVGENMQRRPMRTIATMPLWVPLAALQYGVLEQLRRDRNTIL